MIATIATTRTQVNDAKNPATGKFAPMIVEIVLDTAPPVVYTMGSDEQQVPTMKEGDAMTRITVVRDPHYAPCSFLVCRVDERGNYEPRSDDTLLVQSDWDFPGLARAFGFVPCECGRTDGTVDCPHHTATEMITAAYDWLEDHQGQIVEDPGYFAEATI